MCQWKCRYMYGNHYLRLCDSCYKACKHHCPVHKEISLTRAWRTCMYIAVHVQHVRKHVHIQTSSNYLLVHVNSSTHKLKLTHDCKTVNCKTVNSCTCRWTVVSVHIILRNMWSWSVVNLCKKSPHWKWKIVPFTCHTQAKLHNMRVNNDHITQHIWTHRLRGEELSRAI